MDPRIPEVNVVTEDLDGRTDVIKIGKIYVAFVIGLKGASVNLYVSYVYALKHSKADVILSLNARGARPTLGRRNKVKRSSEERYGDRHARSFNFLLDKHRRHVACINGVSVAVYIILELKKDLYERFILCTHVLVVGIIVGGVHLGDGILCIIHLTVYITEVIYYITVKHYRLLSLYRLVKLLEVSYVNAVADAHNGKSGSLALYLTVSEHAVHRSLTYITVCDLYDSVLVEGDVCHVGLKGKLISEACTHFVFVVGKVKRYFVRRTAKLGSTDGEKVFITVSVTDFRYYKVFRCNNDVCRRRLFNSGLVIGNLKSNGSDARLIGKEGYDAVVYRDTDNVIVGIFNVVGNVRILGRYGKGCVRTLSCFNGKRALIEAYLDFLREAYHAFNAFYGSTVV